jgi:hypothetical protein
MLKRALDVYLEKIVSRKLLVWLTSTGFLVGGLITNEQWVAIAFGYVGIQGFADLATKWKSAGNKQ